MNAKSETRFMEVPIGPIKAKAPKKDMGIPKATQTANDGLKNKERTQNTKIRPRMAFSIIIWSLPRR